MNAQGEPVSGAIIVLAPDLKAARQAARSFAYEQGWVAMQIAIELDPTSPVPAPLHNGLPIHHWRANIEARQRISASSNSFAWPYESSRRLKAGLMVRTLASGENWAGGRRHTMPVGAIGVIRRRLGRGPNFRVAFDAAPGRTYVYSADALVPVNASAPV